LNKTDAETLGEPSLWPRRTMIACDIFFRELCALAARAPVTLDLKLLPKGLHDLGAAEMRPRVQAAVDEVGAGGDAILLAYGLCNLGLDGIVARRCPLVLPRAHDCITLFLGDRARYRAYFEAHPGTYFHTTGWLERAAVGDDLRQLSIQRRTGMDRTYEELVAEYGEDNAQYIREMLHPTQHYGQFTYIEMGLDADRRFIEESRRRAAEKNWTFESVPGAWGLLERLIAGPWDAADFLVVPPGYRVVAAHDDRIVRAEKVAAEM